MDELDSNIGQAFWIGGADFSFQGFDSLIIWEESSHFLTTFCEDSFPIKQQLQPKICLFHSN